MLMFYNCVISRITIVAARVLDCQLESWCKSYEILQSEIHCPTQHITEHGSVPGTYPSFPLHLPMWFLLMCLSCFSTFYLLQKLNHTQEKDRLVEPFHYHKHDTIGWIFNNKSSQESSHLHQKPSRMGPTPASNFFSLLTASIAVSILI